MNELVLLDGIELPAGFRLTEARKGVLRAWGTTALAGHEWRTRARAGEAIAWRNLRGAPRLSRGEMAALRVMAATGWLYRQESETDWRPLVVLKEPLDVIAKRLAAPEACLQARKRELTDPARARWRQADMERRDAVGDGIRLFQEAGAEPRVEGPAVVALYERACQAAAAAGKAETEHAEAERRADALPMPEAQEALAWLVQQVLKGTGNGAER